MHFTVSIALPIVVNEFSSTLKTVFSISEILLQRFGELFASVKNTIDTSIRSSPDYHEYDRDDL